jgi:hypothetical protein
MFVLVATIVLIKAAFCLYIIKQIKKTIALLNRFILVLMLFLYLGIEIASSPTIDFNIYCSNFYDVIRYIWDLNYCNGLIYILLALPIYWSLIKPEEDEMAKTKEKSDNLEQIEEKIDDSEIPPAN